VRADYDAGAKNVIFSTSPGKYSDTAVTATNLTLFWPLDHFGWRLQAQTNGLKTNWATFANSQVTNQVSRRLAGPMAVCSTG